MPKLRKNIKKKPKCVACGDTGLNSKGGRCYPCDVLGKSKVRHKKKVRRHK